jgi:hypothetical protein
MIPAGARCGVHADVAAVDVCKRCGRFLCGECVQLVEEDAYCADCEKRIDKSPSRMAYVTGGTAIATWILTLGAVAVPLVGGLALLASLATLGLGVSELMRIRLRETPRKGRGLVIAAMVIALVPEVLVTLFWIKLRRP